MDHEGRTPTLARRDANPDVHWPAGFTPDAADLFAHDEIGIEAPPSVVWRHLVEAPKWPEWHPSAQDARILSGATDLLDQDTRFEVAMLGVRVNAVVGEFMAYSRLGWLGNGPGVRAYHTWLLTSVADGCQVITEAVANATGILTTFEPDTEALRRGLGLWLSGLKQVSER